MQLLKLFHAPLFNIRQLTRTHTGPMISVKTTALFTLHRPVQADLESGGKLAGCFKSCTQMLKTSSFSSFEIVASLVFQTVGAIIFFDSSIV